MGWLLGRGWADLSVRLRSGPVGLLSSLFFLTNLFLISVFPKQKQNHPKTYQKNLIKYFFEKLVKYRTLWHLACQQNDSKYLILRQGFN